MVSAVPSTVAVIVNVPPLAVFDSSSSPSATAATNAAAPRSPWSLAVSPDTPLISHGSAAVPAPVTTGLHAREAVERRLQLGCRWR